MLPLAGFEHRTARSLVVTPSALNSHDIFCGRCSDFSIRWVRVNTELGAIWAETVDLPGNAAVTMNTEG